MTKPIYLNLIALSLALAALEIDQVVGRRLIQQSRLMYLIDEIGVDPMNSEPQ